MSIHFKVFKQQMTIHNAHGVVGKAQRKPIRVAKDIGRIKV